MKKIRRIQIPNKIIIDRAFPHNAFGLYVELKMRAFNNKVEVMPMKLKETLGWKDNRKLKKYLKTLYNFGLIDKQVDRINNYKLLNISLTSIGEEYFTQVDVNTIRKIKESVRSVKLLRKGKPKDVHEIALRLFYYYEKNYNRDFGKAYPTYEQINKDTRIHSDYIMSINEEFHKNGLVIVRTGEWYKDDNLEMKRKGNQYIPICQRYKNDTE